MSKMISTASKISRQSPQPTGSPVENEPAKPKRLPPIKSPVGLVKGPDMSSVKSKVGSLQNVKHSPAGGTVSIPTKKLQWKAQSKIGSLENKSHKPGGGDVKVTTQKLKWDTKSKINSFQNVHHKPQGGNVKIFHEPIVVAPRGSSSSSSTKLGNSHNADTKSTNASGSSSEVKASAVPHKTPSARIIKQVSKKDLENSMQLLDLN